VPTNPTQAERFAALILWLGNAMESRGLVGWLARPLVALLIDLLGDIKQTLDRLAEVGRRPLHAAPAGAAAARGPADQAGAGRGSRPTATATEARGGRDGGAARGRPSPPGPPPRAGSKTVRPTGETRPGPDRPQPPSRIRDAFGPRDPPPKKIRSERPAPWHADNVPV
jgi:hypothetical protein